MNKRAVLMMMTRRNGQEDRRYEDGYRRRYDRERQDTMRGDWPIRQEYDMRRGSRPESHGGHDWPYGHEPDGAEEYGMRDYRRYPEDKYGRVESRYRPSRSDYEDDRRGGLYDGGGIGFGAERNQPTRSHYQDGQQREHGQPLRAGGTFLMEPAQEPIPFDRQAAEEWVEHMENSDPSHPRGGKWTPDDLKPLARKLGFPEDGEKFWEFYAMMNAMYSDYAPVAKKFGIVSPEFYACMAKAWMEDKDAKDDKTALYYKYIVDR